MPAGKAQTVKALAGAAGDLLIRVTGGSESVRGLAFRAADVRPGDLFFCVVGAQADGHGFAAEAVAAGAGALVVERPLDLAVAQIVVRDSRLAMARVAAKF